WRWFYGDSVFIVDPWLWLMLGVGVWLTRRQRVPTPARGALIFAACYIAVMVVAAQTAHGIVDRLWRETRGAAAAAVMAGQEPITPFTREMIVDAGDHYETGQFSWSSATLKLNPERTLKNSDKPEVALAREAAPNIRAFLVWSRFPYWTLRPENGGTRVSVSDMRFPGGVRGFSASAVVPAVHAPAPD